MCQPSSNGGGGLDRFAILGLFTGETSSKLDPLVPCVRMKRCVLSSLLGRIWTAFDNHVDTKSLWSLEDLIQQNLAWQSCLS